MRKNVLIIGGSGGIGQGIAKVLYEAGYNIIATYNTCRPELQFVKWIKYDLLDMQAGGLMLDEKIDYLIFAAGISASEDLIHSTPEQIYGMMKVTCFSPIEIIRRLLENSNEIKKIVFVSSDAGSDYVNKKGLYSFAKACLNVMIKTLSNELIMKKITVNAIAPGWCETNMAKSVLSLRKMTIDDIQNKKIDGSILEPEEIGNVCRWLLSDSSIHITGQIIEIDSPDSK